MLLAGPLIAAQHVVVVIDDSGSMSNRMRAKGRTKKIDAARNAMTTVLSRLPDEAEVGVLALNAGWLLPLGPVSADEMSATVKGLRASGGTPLGATIKTGADALLRKRAEAHYGTYRLLIVTDGEASDRRLVDSYVPDIMARGILVDVIGVDMKSDHSLATRVHSYRRADDPTALATAIAAALAESDDEPNSAVESDFELLADFPAELAPVMLTALATDNNDPIVGGGVEVTSSGKVSFRPPQPSSSASGSTTWRGLGTMLGMCCLLTVVVIGVTLVAFIKVVTRR
jgi:hypothetical protein